MSSESSVKNSLLKLDASNADTYFEFWLALYQHPEVNPFFFKPRRMPREEMRVLYDAFIANPKANFFIYLDEQHQPMGTCRVTFFTGARSHVAMINAFGICPAVHGKGRGSEMLSAAEFFIVSHPAQKISQIELAYEGDNVRGRNFYVKKFGYQEKINYHDWWHRTEPEFQKDYPWFSDERCCVKYLTQEAMDTTIPLPLVQPIRDYALDKTNFVNAEYTAEEISTILSSYTREEQHEIQKIISRQDHTIYVLRTDNGAEALMCFKPYAEARLTHAVTVPCLIFSDEISNEIAASFVNAALEKYRDQHPVVFHFACSEEDTEDLFYTNGHSKVERLSSVLQLAGFKFLGVYPNYFNETSFVGRNLLGFECCFLNTDDAHRCIGLSKLNVIEKETLRELLPEQEKYSRHEQWNIYLMVRYVAYPQDYSPEEIVQQIEACAKRLEVYPECMKLKEALLEMVRKAPVKLSGFRSLGNREVVPTSATAITRVTNMSL